MTNTYFQFKQFKVEQKECANKVSTDACVFGAFMALLAEGKAILDVGCGSALLTLMVAQGKASLVVGVEIEASCAQQAIANTLASNYSAGITIHCTDIRSFIADEKFELIISNPPFYNNSSKNQTANRNLARQTEFLGPEDWPQILSNNLRTDGLCAFLLSNNDVCASYREVLHEAGFQYLEEVQIYDNNKAACKRVILLGSKVAFDTTFPSKFTYKKEDNTYTKEMNDLLKDFYLYL